MAEGRNSKGQFVKGHTHSKGTYKPGRPPRAVEAKYLKTFRDTVSQEDWAIAVAALLKKAQRGDVSAFRALSAYALGNPTQMIELDNISTIEVVYTKDWQNAS